MELLVKNIDTLTEAEIELWQSNFNKTRTDAVKRKQSDDFRRSVCGDLLILKLARKYRPDGNIAVLWDAHGKPSFADIPVFFSVSHKANKAVLAYGEKPIGVDIEIIAPFNKRLAEKVCNGNELAYINGDPIRFAEVWTVKEAYSKLDGRGISMGFANICVDMNSKTVGGLPFEIMITDGFVCATVSAEA